MALRGIFMRKPLYVLAAAAASLLINAGLFGLAALLSQERALPVELSNPVPVQLVQLPQEEQPIPEPLPEPEPPKPQPPPDFVPDLVQPLVQPPEVAPIRVAIDVPQGPPVELGGGFIFDVGDLDQAPRAVVKGPPAYPFLARQREIEGFVQVRFLVDDRGQVSDVTVLDASPAGIFEQSVLQAVPTWRFEPGKIDGRPVASWVVTTIRFELN